ncbi:oligopeptide transport ATP-binding protein OppF [Peptococcaceae bacterium CEB3]|nr:oligopeptide transport ATP-binding protein OppF [Peptococcaceae bacterium CEB3]
MNAPELAKKQYLLETSGVKKYFPIKKGVLNRIAGYVQAVDGLSFGIFPGETFGLVGESGCGKSTLGRVVLNLQRATAGQVLYDGRDLTKLQMKEMRNLRRELQIIFQDPFGSLNPRLPIKDIMGEPFRVHERVNKREIDEKVIELMHLVGLDPARRNSYPHEFSGGQRQRVGIARAMALHPKFVVADEAVSALDVSVQSQIINLFMRLQRELGLTYLFISHGLNVVRHISDHVGVMYLGKLVEISLTDELYSHPLHPYTLALLSAIPQPDRAKKSQRIILQGDVPSPANPPSGCRFHPRCPYAQVLCRQEEPLLQGTGEDHRVACHFPLG